MFGVKKYIILCFYCMFWYGRYEVFFFCFLELKIIESKFLFDFIIIMELIIIYRFLVISELFVIFSFLIISKMF